MNGYVTMMINVDRIEFLQRPTGKELLRHPFIKRAKKTAYLQELIENYAKWKAAGGGQDSSSDESDL